MMARRIIRNLFQISSTFSVSLVVVLLSWLVTIVPLNIEFLAPLEIALKEFEYSDVVISQIGMDRNLRIDTGIVLVNVGKAGRSQIADIIAAVDEAKPLAIGLDIMFMPNGDTAGTSHLCEVVRQAKARIVVAEVLTHDLKKTSDYTGIERGIFNESHHVVFGFVNLPGSSTYRTVRRWQRSATIGEQHEQSFALALLNAGAKVNASEWTTDGLENLCYQRQKTWFVIEGNDILCNSQKRQVLAGRRILIGYLGDVLGDTSRIEDRFFTPLNASYIGRSTPDMYGLEIHATALSMLLHGHRLQNIHPLFDALVAFIIALIIISFNRRFVTNMRSFGEFVTRLIQVVILSGVFSAMAYMLLEVDVLVPIDISVACSLLCLDIATIYDGTALTLYRSVKSASRRTRLTYRQYQRRRTNRQDHYQ